MSNLISMKYRFKRLLRIFFILLLVLLIGLFVFEFITSSPKNLRFTNVTSNSVTLSWDTIFPQGASVVSTDPKNKLPILLRPFLKNESYDTRDIANAELKAVEKTNQNIQNSEELTFNNLNVEISVTKRGRYYTHHVEVTGLDSEKEYSFMVGNALLFQKAIDDNNISTIKTLPIPKSVPTPRPAYGSIMDAKNNGSTPTNDLAKITDGILYINYLDKASNKRSTTISGSLNEDGYWYIDMNSALNVEGKPFLEEYIGTETELFLEMQLNAGPLGKWKTTREEAISSPASPIIINVPDIPKDLPGATIEISQNSELVKGVSAQKVGDCAFVDYCGPCVYYQKGGSCTCNQETLKARNCVGGGQPQENTSCGNGASKLGDVKKYNNDCKVCTTKEQNGYYVGVYQTNNNDYDPANNCEPRSKAKKQIKNNELCNEAQGCKCEVSGKDIKINEYCTDGKQTQIDAGERCEDRDGCACINSKQVSVRYNGVCIAKDDVRSDDDNSEEEIISNPPTSSNPNPNLANGDICRSGNIIAGIWNSEKKICEERINANRLTSEQIKNLHCWGWGYLAYPNEIYDIEGNRYLCSRGTFNADGKYIKVSDISGQAPCIEEKPCKSIVKTQCISSSGKLLRCQESNGEYKWTDEDLIPESFTVELIKIETVAKGRKCESNSCKCENINDAIISSKPYYIINYSEYCPEVSTCKESNKGKVCNSIGNTCILKQDPVTYVNSYVCEGATVSALPSKGSNLISVLGSKVYAADSKYIIDQSSGIVSGLEEGTYEFEYENELYMFTVNDKQLNAQNGQILLYIDSNKNGNYDENVDKKISDFASQVEINQVNQSYKYKLTEGYNFVSFPFISIDEKARTAAGMLEMLNDLTNGAVYSISKFDNSWKTVGKNQQLYDINNFQLVPGQGYIIKVASNVEVSIPGFSVKFETDSDKAPITLYQGWNLIGTYGTNVKQYTAKTLIEGINNFKAIDFTADNVSRWESDVQRYDGLQITNQNGIDITYGFDFPINSQQAYFVRILQGKGNWQPELEK